MSLASEISSVSADIKQIIVGPGRSGLVQFAGSAPAVGAASVGAQQAGAAIFRFRSLKLCMET